MTLGRRRSGSRIPEFRRAKKVATESESGPESAHPMTHPTQDERYTRPTCCGVKEYGNVSAVGVRFAKDLADRNAKDHTPR